MDSENKTDMIARASQHRRAMVTVGDTVHVIESVFRVDFHLSFPFLVGDPILPHFQHKQNRFLYDYGHSFITDKRPDNNAHMHISPLVSLICPLTIHIWFG